MTGPEIARSDLPRVRQYLDRVVAEAVNEAAAALRAVREWCDRTERAASTSNSEDVFQARMELVDEVRRLLPAVGEDKP